MVLDLGERGAPEGMQCPHCHVTLKMSSREGIEIDYCPKCRGVWLDRGELDKIIERSVPEAPVAAPSHKRESRRDKYDRYDRDDDDRRERRDHKRKKRSSWLSDIFEELT